jgi:hypothetical protein
MPSSFLTPATVWWCWGVSQCAGRGSGVPVTIHSAHVSTVRHGQLASTQVYADQTAALKAAGLEG